MFDWELIAIYWPEFIPGIITTVQLLIAALLLGLLLAIGLTTLSLSQRRWLTIPVETYLFFIRGTPLLVQLFLIYYGLGQFEWIRNSPLWHVLHEPLACAIIAFALNTAAYTTVLLRGAIQAIPQGQVNAAFALGMRYQHILRTIILPQVFRRALPAYSNEVLMIMKATSLASTITLLDITGITQQIIAETYAPIEFYLVAGAVYLVLNSIIVGVFKLLEKKFRTV